MSALRLAFFILNLESCISRLNVIPCHDLTLSVNEPENAAAQTGAGTSFGANGEQHTRAAELSTYFCALTIRKHLLKICFERSGRGQEPSRGHKFSISENFLSIRDFTSSMRLHFRSDLVGVALVGAKPLHLLSQTALPLKSPTGAFIAPLRYANAVPPQTLLRADEEELCQFDTIPPTIEKTERSRRGTPCCTYRYRLWSLAGCVLFRGAPCFCFEKKLEK